MTVQLELGMYRQMPQCRGERAWIRAGIQKRKKERGKKEKATLSEADSESKWAGLGVRICMDSFVAVGGALLKGGGISPIKGIVTIPSSLSCLWVYLVSFYLWLQEVCFLL